MQASGDDQPWCAHKLSGCVSALTARRHHHGAPTDTVRVRSDCPPSSLLAVVSRDRVEPSRSPPPLPGARPPPPPVLLAQLGESRHSRGRTSSAIQVLSGRLFLRGETVLVRGGRPFFSGNSQLVAAVGSGSGDRPPTLSGVPDREHLLASVAEDLDGACLFYGASVLQLGSLQVLMGRPQLHLAGQQHQLESLARLPTSAMRPVGPEDLQDGADDGGGGFVRDRAKSGGVAPAAAASAAPPTRTLLLLGGRCLLRGGTLTILAGLLHFAGAWHRVQTGRGRPAPRLTGVSVLGRRRRDSDAREPDDSGTAAIELALLESGERPLLLGNALLYALGGTVFSGSIPLLTGAVLAMSPNASPVPLEQQELLLMRLAPPASRDAVRLFLDRGSFSVSQANGLLRATAGTVWLRAKKVTLGCGSSDQLVVQSALVFPQPDDELDCVNYEGRDVLFKDGHLYLDDLTPLLRGGRICVGQQELPLDWLSGDQSSQGGAKRSPSAAKLDEFSSSQLPAVDPDDSTALFDNPPLQDMDVELLTDGLCLLESGCLHLLRGRLSLAGETVLIDQGVTHFAAGCGLTRPLESAGFPPPRILGHPLMRPKDARQWAKRLDQRLDRATFEHVRLSMCRGAVWLNSRVPLLRSYRLLLNGRLFEGPQLMEGRQLVQAHGFTGTYSVVANCKSEALVFNLRARFARELQFLFSQ